MTWAGSSCDRQWERESRFLAGLTQIHRNSVVPEELASCPNFHDGQKMDLEDVADLVSRAEVPGEG